MRLDAAMPEGEDLQRWRILARDLVTYPETVALATLLASPAWRLRVAADSGGHLPYRSADVLCVPGELGDHLRRPWFTEHLAACTHGPLFAWTYQCIRTKGGGEDDEQRLWQVPLALRPRPPADVLAGYSRRQTEGTEGLPAQKRLRGHSVHAEVAFAAGLAHARTYAAQHGHLATQRDTRVGSFALGKWVHNQQTLALALPEEKAAALKEVDPWWNIPWSVKWQRSYYRARDHVRCHGPRLPRHPRADRGVAVPAVHRLQLTPPRTAPSAGRHRPHGPGRRQRTPAPNEPDSGHRYSCCPCTRLRRRTRMPGPGHQEHLVPGVFAREVARCPACPRPPPGRASAPSGARRDRLVVEPAVALGVAAHLAPDPRSCPRPAPRGCRKELAGRQ